MTYYGRIVREEDSHTMRDRHDLMLVAWSEGMPLKAIALMTGLTNHSSVLHHLDNKCRCYTEEADPCAGCRVRRVRRK